MKILTIKTFVLSNKIKEYKFPLPSYFYDGILLLKIKTDEDIFSFIEISPYATDIKKLKMIYDKKIIPFLVNQDVTSLLKMREKITQNHQKNELWNVKYVRGGLLDIEFIAQYIQLIHASKFPEILSTNTVKVLKKASGLGLIRSKNGKILLEALNIWQNLQSLIPLVDIQNLSNYSLNISPGHQLLNALKANTFLELEAQMKMQSTQVTNIFKELIS